MTEPHLHPKDWSGVCNRSVLCTDLPPLEHNQLTGALQLTTTMTTQQDREVLNSILNPNLPLGEAVYDPEEQVVEETAREDSEEVVEAEKDAVRAAEAGDLKKAIELFDQVT